SNRGLIKFHYVQNADEFARVAMEKIEEVKKKTFHNPAPAPTAAPTQSTGNDTMEKLGSLKKMLENGLITQEEFEVKRKELLEKL
ncbi:MAG: SHOCT domain-containing protein, partial [Ruminococcus sp.]|nr:SHOCT domain-containing protein [Ruminococcus sp.]